MLSQLLLPPTQIPCMVLKFYFFIMSSIKIEEHLITFRCIVNLRLGDHYKPSLLSFTLLYLFSFSFVFFFMYVCVFSLFCSPFCVNNPSTLPFVITHTL